jgi:hypothetical protein
VIDLLYDWLGRHIDGLTTIRRTAA